MNKFGVWVALTGSVLCAGSTVASFAMLATDPDPVELVAGDEDPNYIGSVNCGLSCDTGVYNYHQWCTVGYCSSGQSCCGWGQCDEAGTGCTGQLVCCNAGQTCKSGLGTNPPGLPSCH